jgi:hypothetical protein
MTRRETCADELPHLQLIITNPVKLDKKKADLFVQHIMVQILFFSQRGQPNIGTAVSFLCGRLRNSDIDDYKNLARVVKCLYSLVNMPQVLSSDRVWHYTLVVGCIICSTR